MSAYHVAARASLGATAESAVAKKPVREEPLDEPPVEPTVEPFVAPTAATGTGTSTGTTSLTVASVTGTIVLGSTITGTGVPANTTLVSQVSGPQGGAGTYVTSAATTLTAIALTFTPGPTVGFFPDFVPIIPPPPIGNPVGVPTFPPPTPPPIGQVPTGPLVGPAVAAAPVPPSLAGIAQPSYGSGSATVPPVNGYFPQFTTTTAYAGFPNQPPTGVPIVFANIFNQPTFSGGVWAYPALPSTPTVGQIILDGWGLPGPSGSGPGPPTYPNPPGAGLNNAIALRGGYAESFERPGGTVFPGGDTSQLHQPEPSPDRRGKRSSSRYSSGDTDSSK